MTTWPGGAWPSHARVAAGAGHGGGGRVEQRRDAVFRQEGERFLGFAQRVS